MAGDMAGEMTGVACTHLDQIDLSSTPSADGCEDCLRVGGRWLHLRMCRACGHVGCCDSSPARHARAHAGETSHAIISSYEPGEGWWWCFVDEVDFELADAPDYAHS
jgi:hypothetical protein